MSRYALRFVALGYLLMLLIIPIGMVLYRTFQDGFGPFWDAIQQPDAMHALKLTLEVTLISVPINTVFGIVFALMLVRHDVPGKAFWNALLALPFAVSPVIVGLGLILVYGRTTGWFGDDLAAQGIDVIFSVPGIVLATMFVSLPFVAREVMPVLREIGSEQEEAAATLGASSMQTFWRVTLPAIRWGVIYGVILTTARCLGEYGAVAVVSGKIIGETETGTVFVERAYQGFDKVGAYSVSVVLALMAIATVAVMSLIKPRREA